jgi:Holliday junction resolvase RusA-like endonuclease
MSAAIFFVVPGQPVGKGRPRASSRGGFVRMYTDAKTLSYEQLIAKQATYAMGNLAEMLYTPISMRIVALYNIPVSWSKRKQQLALSGDLIPGKPDLDNVAKAVLDALNGVVYEDDKQVIRLVIEKSYSFEPRIEVYVHEVLK